MLKEELTKQQLGKRGRQSGKKFELKVRKDLEDDGWIVSKWNNTIDFENNKLIQAKSKYNPFTKRVMSEGSGFPDFVAYKLVNELFVVIGVESKKAKYLDKEEKKMIEWLREHRIFANIFVAYPKKEEGKRNINVEYYVPAGV